MSKLVATRSRYKEVHRNALLEIGAIRARLRYVHLESHLRQKQLLTAEQIKKYDELRGYHGAMQDHSKHSNIDH